MLSLLLEQFPQFTQEVDRFCRSRGGEFDRGEANWALELVQHARVVAVTRAASGAFDEDRAVQRHRRCRGPGDEYSSDQDLRREHSQQTEKEVALGLDLLRLAERVHLTLLPLLDHLLDFQKIGDLIRLEYHVVR